MKTYKTEKMVVVLRDRDRPDLNKAGFAALVDAELHKMIKVLDERTDIDEFLALQDLTPMNTRTVFWTIRGCNAIRQISTYNSHDDAITVHLQSEFIVEVPSGVANSEWTADVQAAGTKQ